MKRRSYFIGIKSLTNWPLPQPEYPAWNLATLRPLAEFAWRTIPRRFLWKKIQTEKRLVIHATTITTENFGFTTLWLTRFRLWQKRKNYSPHVENFALFTGWKWITTEKGTIHLDLPVLFIFRVEIAFRKVWKKTKMSVRIFFAFRQLPTRKRTKTN